MIGHPPSPPLFPTPPLFRPGATDAHTRRRCTAGGAANAVHLLVAEGELQPRLQLSRVPDRKSTRLNSSHANISYAVLCLKKKKNNHTINLHDNSIQE